jgi:hypothetical protein
MSGRVFDVNLILNLRIDEAAKEWGVAKEWLARESLMVMANKAKEFSPVLTGLNKKSIRWEIVKRAGKTMGRLFTTSGYGGYLEIGTRFMEGRRYIRKGVKASGDDIVAAVKEMLKHA